MIDIGLFAVTESQCTEDEHDDEDEDEYPGKPRLFLGVDMDTIAV